QQAYDTALRNNLQLRSSDLQIERSRALVGSGYAIPRTGIFAENEDINPEDRKGILKIGVSQSLDWPGLYKAQRNLLQQQVGVVEAARRVRELEIRRDLQVAYYQIWYLQSKQELWRRLDSLYSSFARAASLRVRTGESAGLDSLSASARAREASVQLSLLQRDIQASQEALKRVLNTSNAFLPPLTPVEKIAVPNFSDSVGAHPSLRVQEQNINVAEAELNVQRQSNKPSFEGRFFSQRLYGISNPYSGFSVTVGIPIFGKGAYRSKIRAAQVERQYQESVLRYDRLALATAYNQSMQQLRKDQELLRYYEESGLAQAEAIIKAANLAYRGGEINFNDLSQYLTQAIDIQKAYLDILNGYNQAAIQVNYYLNR
ncbi:MAG: TolC family protein, partial [Chitinophagaceae bacterium]